MDLSRIYLDNAATSWPKPESVYAAVDDFQRRVGASAGRGVYHEATEVGRLVFAARRAIAQLLGVKEPKRIIFTHNGTDALNLALYGLLLPNDHVITTVAEHNSVLRPLRHLEQSRSLNVTRLGVDAAGHVDLDHVRQALTKQTRLIVLTAASNVTGTLQPINEVGQIAKVAGVRFLIDATQAVGHVPFSVDECHADLVAMPGHKGLLGPLGTGVLYIAPGVEQELESIRQGGTGSRSNDDLQPDELPDKYEAGNLNVPGIIGLKAGAEFLLFEGVAPIREHELSLTRRLLDGLSVLSANKKLCIVGPSSAESRVGVVSLTLSGYEPQEAATLLDANYRIQVRAGLHCAPLIHRALGTLSTGGTLRISFGPFNTLEHVDQTINALTEIFDA